MVIIKSKTTGNLVIEKDTEGHVPSPDEMKAYPEVAAALATGDVLIWENTEENVGGYLGRLPAVFWY